MHEPQLYIFLTLYSVSVAGLLYGELREIPWLRCLCKPIAAACFLSVAYVCGAASSVYGQLVFAGLMFSFIGDCALLKYGAGRLFGFGVSAFLLAHIAYGLAFAKLAEIPLVLASSLFAAALLGGALKPLWIKASDKGVKMDSLISAYTATIGIMAILAGAAAYTSGHYSIALAASLFVISDVCVGKNRFGPSSLRQFWVITPFYFAAQWLFALSV